MSRLPLLKHPMMHFRNKWLNHKCKYAVAPQGTVIKEIDGVKFPCDFSLGKRMKSIYFGCYQFEVASIIKKILKPGGIFIDVGANIGYISAIGAAIVGKTGQVHSFEPVLKHFDYLQKMVQLNADYRISANNVALGDIEGSGRITYHRCNIGGSSMVPGLVPKENAAETFNVEVKRLDKYIKEKQLQRISLIKIDTEGFELPVLLGTKSFFDSYVHKGDLPAVIAEVDPYALKLMGKDPGELVDFMSNYGYKSYDICGRCSVNIRKMTKKGDVLFRT
ncbi:MAG: FkbM family methyltransferase [Sedimentisphaerales bacterium]